MPTHNRHLLLCECVEAILESASGKPVEVIVVDDGSQPPVDPLALAPEGTVTLLRLSGEGPGAARNAGARAARGDLILFTDDDTAPTRGWVAAALAFLDDNPNAVGVTGPVLSVSWDPLYAQSVECDVAGHYWTCNIAYRRSVFEAIGGFRADVFRNAHAEDRDLAIRALRFGEIGFAAEMAVSHTPRGIALRDVARQARWARDDLALYALHPQLTTEFGLPPKLALVVGSARWWLGLALRPEARRSVRAIARGLALSAVGTGSTAWAVLRTPSARALRARYETDAG